MYHLLPQNLELPKLQNPDLSMTLQSDSHSRFHRAFLGFPIGLQKHFKKISIPVLFIDCCHFQSPHCDGRIIALTSRSGNGLTLLLAIGIIPVENIDHISWFLQLCALHGIDLNCALFTDCGPLSSATGHLQTSTTLKLSPMFCLQHVIWNVCHEFSQRCGEK